MTDELDKILDTAKVNWNNSPDEIFDKGVMAYAKQAIQALIADQMAEYQAQLLKDYKEDIATAVREARIDEIKRYREAMTFAHITPSIYAAERIPELLSEEQS